MSFDVIIVGGGLAGLSLARALRDTRLQIALVERRPPVPATGWDARVYAVTPANVAFLERIGVWSHLEHRRIAPIHAMQIFGDAGARLRFSAFESGLETLGCVVESSLMTTELWESVKRQSNVTLCCPAGPATLDRTPTGARLTLDDRRTLTGRLIVGADGRDSWIRQAAGLAARAQPYGEMGVVANFACAEPHRGEARQWFREDGILAWLPLAGDDGVHRLSIVWSTPEAHAQALLALEPEAFAARVAAAGGNALGPLQTITAAQAFPLHRLVVAERVAPRLALIGDAAHGVHPLSGHGINLGFRDAEALAETLASAPPLQDPGTLALLRRYERARQEETRLLQYTTHTLHRLFHEKLSALKFLRNAGMNLTDRLPVVKNLLARYATGAF